MSLQQIPRSKGLFLALKSSLEKQLLMFAFPDDVSALDKNSTQDLLKWLLRQKGVSDEEVASCVLPSLTGPKLLRAVVDDPELLLGQWRLAYIDKGVGVPSWLEAWARMVYDKLNALPAVEPRQPLSRFLYSF
jgi:hypothetical protein